MDKIQFFVMLIMLIDLISVTQSLWKEQRKRIRRLRGDKMTHDEMIAKISEWKDICRNFSWDGVDAFGIEDNTVKLSIALIDSGIVDNFKGRNSRLRELPC